MLDAMVRDRLLPIAEQEWSNHHLCYGNAGWAVAATHPQAELWANANLRHRGYRTYLPVHAVRRRDPTLRTLSRIVDAPLFPGYLFVWFDPRDPWRPIRETPGVRHLIHCGSQVQYAPEAAVAALQAGEAARRMPPTRESLYRPGAACRLDYGPCQGLDAVVLSVSGDRALVSLMMLGALRQVAVALDCLRLRD